MAWKVIILGKSTINGQGSVRFPEENVLNGSLCHSDSRNVQKHILVPSQGLSKARTNECCMNWVKMGVGFYFWAGWSLPDVDFGHPEATIKALCLRCEPQVEYCGKLKQRAGHEGAYDSNMENSVGFYVPS